MLLNSPDSCPGQSALFEGRAATAQSDRLHGIVSGRDWVLKAQKLTTTE
jgi:hypothetical protein